MIARMGDMNGFSIHGRHLVLITLLALFSRTAEAQTRIVLVDNPNPSSVEQYAWVGSRILTLIGRRLALFGHDVVFPRIAEAVGREHLAGLRMTIRVGRPRADLRRGALPVVARVGRRRFRGRGSSEDLDALADELALKIHRHLSGSAPPHARSILRDFALPHLAQRLLGRAETRLRQGQVRQARVMLGRAIERIPNYVPITDIMNLRSLRLRADGPSTELVSAALERADEAVRRNDSTEVIDAYLDAIRYGVQPRLRWKVSLPRVQRDVWIDGDDVWVTWRRNWMVLSATSGRIKGRGRSRGRTLGSLNGEQLERLGTQLRRRRTNGHLRWRRQLPKELTKTVRVVGAGQIAIVGGNGLGWIEASLGQTGPILDGYSVLALGEPGAVVETSKRTKKRVVGFVRPGRSAAAWQVELAVPVQQAALTNARVVLRLKGQLLILDLHNGQQRGSIPLPDNARIVGARGRHAVVQIGPTETMIIDVLAGAPTSRVQGPSRPIGVYSSSFVLTILYASGDILHWDPDGLLQDRAQVKAPIRLIEAATSSSGPVVETRNALYGFSEFQPDRRSDAELLLSIARAAQAIGRSRDARVIATYLAWLSSGRTREAEELRAELLFDDGGEFASHLAQRAHKRAQLARSSTVALPAFEFAE